MTPIHNKHFVTHAGFRKDIRDKLLHTGMHYWDHPMIIRDIVTPMDHDVFSLLRDIQFLVERYSYDPKSRGWWYR